MKQLFLILSLFLLFGKVPSFAQKSNAANDNLEWFTDLMKAQDRSLATRKPIFGFFTGSDWCGWCRKLQNDVFSKTSFIKWAKANVILLELDFPRQKQLPPETAQQNAGLQQAFQVRGYPTVWIFFMAHDTANNKMNITPLGSLGYPSGSEPGKEDVKFLTDANAILKNGKAN